MLKPEDIAAIFEWIELLLIGSLKRNLASHKQEEEKEGFNWTAWQAEKLRNVDSFRRQTRSIMSQYTDIIDSETRQLLEEQFNENAVLPEKNNETTVGDGVLDVPQEQSIEITPEPHFFGVDRTKNEKLIEDVTNIEKQAETAALRMTDDVYRQTVNRVQLAMATGSMSYEKAVDTAVADFLAQGINCIEYRDGRRVNIADYVRMVLRTTSTRAALQGKSAKFKAQGYDTVLVSSYGMCSKTCLPWQGRAYIEDTFSYWDGEVEERNGILYGKSNYCGKWFPLLSSAIEKGLFHPNCRHSINQYIDGVTKLPEPIDNSDSERRYKEEQVLRSLEREVRKAKRKVEGFTDAENIKKAKAELREAQKNVREYIAKVNAEEGARVLVRNPLQEKIYESEVNSEIRLEPDKISMSASDTTILSQAESIAHNSSEYVEIEKYAEEKGINIHAVKEFDGDVSILKEQIDAIEEIRTEYGVKKKITILFSELPDNDLAETGNGADTITFNKKALRNRNITESFLKEDRTLATDKVKGIAYHEMGHIISYVYGEKGLDIARKAYYNIFEKEISPQEMLNWLRDSISIYSAYIPPNRAVGIFKTKKFREVTPEILSLDKTKPNKFTNEFVKLLKEAYNL